VKERSIILTGHEVRGFLAGTQTQMRRAVALRGFMASITPGYEWTHRDRRGLWNDHATVDLIAKRSPFGAVGQLLWCRETWAHDAPSLEALQSEVEDVFGSSHGPYYRVDRVHEGSGLRWRSSTQMPRWASRLTLEVTGVRVQRLQDASDADAKAEGVQLGAYLYDGLAAEQPYKFELEKQIRYSRGPLKWDENPWTWLVSFKRVSP
jgi:hypothetical protein